MSMGQNESTATHPSSNNQYRPPTFRPQTVATAASDDTRHFESVSSRLQSSSIDSHTEMSQPSTVTNAAAAAATGTATAPPPPAPGATASQDPTASAAAPNPILVAANDSNSAGSGGSGGAASKDPVTNILSAAIEQRRTDSDAAAPAAPAPAPAAAADNKSPASESSGGAGGTPRTATTAPGRNPRSPAPAVSRRSVKVGSSDASGMHQRRSIIKPKSTADSDSDGDAESDAGVSESGDGYGSSAPTKPVEAEDLTEATREEALQFRINLSIFIV